ncbi:MAG: substrate-binding domain-containing protein [Colwellia sp.]|nr:substrate-binding domain-containing protein [Colwellia sp.]
MYIFKSRLAITIFLVSYSVAFFCQAGADFKVVFVNPGYKNDNPTGSFWSKVSRFMDAAANDLNIELVTIYAQRNRILMAHLTKEIIDYSPDYVILVNEQGAAFNLVKQVSAYDIPIFMLLNNISEEKLALLSSKEVGLIYGSLVPDNYVVGKKLINDLITMYESLPDKMDTNISRNVFALQGDYNTQASLDRERGLIDGLLNNKRLQHIDSTVANWSKQQAYQKVKGILKRTRIDIIWAANDAMAFGAKKAVLESKVEYPIIIGGINWDIDDSHYPVDLSYGGHVTLGAQSLIMLRGIHDNYLPENQRHQTINIFESSLRPAFHTFTKRLKNNALEYYDFSKFSYALKNKLSFTIDNLEKTFEIPISKK